MNIKACQLVWPEQWSWLYVCQEHQSMRGGKHLIIKVPHQRNHRIWSIFSSFVHTWGKKTKKKTQNNNNKKHARKAKSPFQCPNSESTVEHKIYTHLHVPREPLYFQVIPSFTSSSLIYLWYNYSLKKTMDLSNLPFLCS